MQVEDAGLDRPYRAEFDDLSVPERFSGGIAAGDYDGDGDIDLYVVGGDLDPNSLYENQGDGTFLDTTEEMTPVITHKGSGPAFGDIDGDGDLDLFLGAVEGGRYYVLENRDGTFFDETSGSGIELNASNTVSATFFDYDSDGYLDLFLSHWGVDREAGEDTETVWRNRGDGTFTSASLETGIAAGLLEGDTDLSFTPNLADIDNDGDGDLLVTGDEGTSQVFLNDGDGSFVKSTDRDVIVDQAGSGAAVFDYDNDGDLDWFVSSNHIAGGDRTGNRLYRNTGSGEFEDATEAANVADGGWGWGTCAADFDNDGNLDIFQVNGWGEDSGNDFRDIPVRFFYSQGDGSFEERAADFGLEDAGQGRGVACFDAERDGDVDIVLTNASTDHIVYYRNDTENDNHYLTVKVAALGANTSGVGALVEARTSDGTQIRTVGGTSNYASHDPLEAHFGLGEETTVDIRVVWPDGEVSRENDVEGRPGRHARATPAATAAGRPAGQRRRLLRRGRSGRGSGPATYCGLPLQPLVEHRRRHLWRCLFRRDDIYHAGRQRQRYCALRPGRSSGPGRIGGTALERGAARIDPKRLCAPRRARPQPVPRVRRHVRHLGGIRRCRSSLAAGPHEGWRDVRVRTRSACRSRRSRSIESSPRGGHELRRVSPDRASVHARAGVGTAPDHAGYRGAHGLPGAAPRLRSR